MKQVEVLYTNVFERNLQAYESAKYRLIGNQGSTRSSKTYSITQLLALYIPYKEKRSISIVSPSLPHLKRGARRDFLEIMEGAGIYSDNDFNKTDNVYYYPNGSYVEFFGAEDVGKVRGPGRDILYVNEANLLPYNVYKQLALRTTKTIFLDFNPVEESSWVYDESDKEGNFLIHSTYKDNLPFLSKEQVDEIESLQFADENLWKVFGLGQRGATSDVVYTHWKQVHEMPGRGEVFYGQDFGYNVPSALVEIEVWEGGIYVKEILYETKLTTGDLIERYKGLNLNKSAEIFCDSAEPKTIEELRRAGYNAKESDKDVTEGIRKVKSMPLYITQSSVNVIKEIKSYKWRTDSSGRTVKDKDKDEPVKFNDHSMDAMRYGVFTKLSKPTYGVLAG